MSLAVRALCSLLGVVVLVTAGRVVGPALGQVLAGPPPPCLFGSITNTAAPTISPSSVVVGGTVNVTSPGGWSYCGDTFTGYQWQWKRSDGATLSSGTSTTVPNYATQSGDVNMSVHVEVAGCDASLGCGSSVASSSSSVTPPPNSPPLTPFEDIFPWNNATIDGRCPASRKWQGFGLV